MRWWLCAILICLLIFPVHPSEPIANELLEISKELETASALLKQGLEKVEQSFENSEIALLKAEAALQRAESLLAKAEEKSKAADRALMISEEESKFLRERQSDLGQLFEDYKKQRQKELRRHKVIQGIMIVAIIVEGILLARQSQSK